MATKRLDQLGDTAREAMENTAEGAREAFEKVAAANTEASGALQESFSNALKGVQEYNRKIAEFAATNTQAHVEFVRRLGTVRSPTDFVEVCQSHSSEQLRMLTEQAKELAELAQHIAASSGEPLKKGFDKTMQASQFPGRSY